ncbi:MAG: hypothetical protein ABI680_15730 [Chthoniobacteraceae bacterium]
MAFAQTLRTFIPLVIGLMVGGVGAGMYLDSLPADEGSERARANNLERELKRLQSRIASLEAADERGGTGKHLGKAKRTFADGARSIAEDLREGRPVTPEDIFRASQPLLRDLAPLFDRMRVRQQGELIDSLAGGLTREYHLPPEKQALVRQWFEQKAAAEAARWNALITQDGTRLQDLMRAAADVRPDEGIDPLMESILTGDELENFKSERLQQRLERIQNEADLTVERLNSIVGLDEAQSDRVFAIVARNSRDYDPSMVLDGVSGDLGATPTGNPRAAILEVLKPDQRAAYDAEKARRRGEAAKDLEAMGLILPADWELFDRFGF